MAGLEKVGFGGTGEQRRSKKSEWKTLRKELKEMEQRSIDEVVGQAQVPIITFNLHRSH